jgi:transcription elongation GreA/GreB family factor
MVISAMNKALTTSSKTSPHRKAALRQALLDSLQLTLAAARASYQAAIEGATHAEARAENSKDTRGLEQSYVARGQAQRVAELETAIATVTTVTVNDHGAGVVRIGSVVQVIDEHQAATVYWIAPFGGGTVIDGVTVVTPQSPLGRALVGRNTGDEITIGDGARKRSAEIARID